MIIRTKLPTIENSAYAQTMGTIKMGIEKRKLVALIGPPGSGKSSILDDVTKKYPSAHFINCAPTMTTRNLLVKIANSISTNVKGDTYNVQKQLTDYLISNPDHILLFDECENLHRGNVYKIDVLRQIYDESNIPMVLCGTYHLQTILAGANNNQPQIFRRLFKAEQKSVTKEEFTKYIDQLEKLLVIRFTTEARSELFAICTDMDNGGIGIFINLLEIALTFTRENWEEICTNYKNGIQSDTSTLKPAIIDKEILRYTARFQMKK